MPRLEVGDSAPDVPFHDDGRQRSLGELWAGGPVVLFFYPKDGTPVCTKQACRLRDVHNTFGRAGATVIGVSGDSDRRHRRFAADHQLPFTLVSDRDATLRRAFGVSKTIGLFPGRETFVIDRHGVVRYVFRGQFDLTSHVDAALRVVERLSEPTDAEVET